MRTVSEIVPVRSVRLSSGIPEFDWLFGHTGGNFGVPSGKISYLCGGKGVGKSRLLTYLLLSYNVRCNFSVMFFQGEVSPGVFVSEKMPKNFRSNDFYISDMVSLDEQVNYIDKYRPKIVVIDSLNMMSEYRNGHGSRDIVDKYRSVLERHNSFAFFVMQLNKDGSAKGNTDFPHLSDIELSAYKDKYSLDSDFYLEVGKNRYGPSGKAMTWRHGSKCVLPYSLDRFSDWEYWKHGSRQDIDDFVNHRLENSRLMLNLPLVFKNYSRWNFLYNRK